MRLHSVTLRNIRSYISETVEFPEGNVLLAGDIGSGKSTVLLAIEFAIFGIKKGELSGEALLRNGKREGSVEVTLTINGRPYTIKRTLKRTKDGVKQEAGYILSGDVKKEGTPVELRSSILNLLGYPPELLEKGKDLIYRYTVYTPQEDMKRILTENSETRLDVLRRVFQIDKYKRIRENSQVIVRRLREQISMHEGRALTLEKNILAFKGFEEALGGIQARLALKQQEHDGYAAALSQKENEAKAMQQQLKDLREKRARFERNAAILQGISQQRKRLQQDIDHLQTLIVPVRLEASRSHKEEIAQQREAIRSIQDSERENQRKQGELAARERQARSVIASLIALDNCPTCLQAVPAAHKGQVIEREQGAAGALALEKSGLAQEYGALVASRKGLEEKLETLQKRQQELDIMLLKDRQNKTYEDQIAAKKRSLEELKASAGEINGTQQDLSAALLSAKELEASEQRIDEELMQARKREKDTASELSALKTEELSARQRKEALAAEIREQQEAKAAAATARALCSWLSEPFPALMSVIEQHVMARIQQEFNTLFSEWFALLIEDETLTARLDDRFVPIITQNGYDTDIEYLSGGERTSAALAYRLALNKVINDIIEHIHTKDLIILDEPTDGFSSEQLDRLREVLDRLSLGQVIIVSHEQKIEGFVQSVIRVRKEEHVSRISQVA